MLGSSREERKKVKCGHGHTVVLSVRQWKKWNVYCGTTITHLSRSLKGMRALEPTVTAGRK